jgi:flotillin
VLDVKLIVRDLVEEFIKNAPTIFRELMEPARNIESIRVLNIGANSGLGSGNGGDAVGRVLGSILSSSAVIPVVREILNFSKLDTDKVMERLTEKIPELREYMADKER